MIIKFEVHTTSDLNRGLVHAASAPLKDAVFNKDENRWEVEVASLERLMEIAFEAKSCIRLLVNNPPGGKRQGTDLPILEINDDYD